MVQAQAKKLCPRWPFVTCGRSGSPIKTAQSFNWPTAYVITAFLVSVGALAAVLIGEPDLPQVTKGQRGQSFL
ncbi:MAG: hypothetical protein AAF862_11755, partial [Pseudomonadota bacterium]